MFIDKILNISKNNMLFLRNVLKMKVLNYTFAVLLLQLFILQTLSKSYDGYKVFQINTTTSDDLQKLMSIVSQVNGTRVWRLGEPSDVMVAPETQQEFISGLHNNSLYYITKIQNLVRKSVHKFRTYAAPLDVPEGSISFDRYYRSAEINAYLENLAEKYSNLTSVINIGKTFEGRDMKLLRVSTGSHKTKPAIFIDGGIHAREWIAVAQVLYIINQLVENRSENFDLLENVDWYLLPLINHDGYEYSYDVDRYWRKTRSGSENVTNEDCVGADANRNFDFHYTEDKFTLDRCGELYRGDEPFSEPETRNLRDFATQIKDKLKLYVSFHNYGPAILYPWGHSRLEYPDNKEELHNLGLSIRKLVKGGYNVGTTSRVMYIATGQSSDWMKGVLGVPLTYTIELPGGGEGGFDVPEEDIEKIVTEMFKGVKLLGQYVSNNYPIDNK